MFYTLVFILACLIGFVMGYLGMKRWNKQKLWEIQEALERRLYNVEQERIKDAVAEGDRLWEIEKESLIKRLDTRGIHEN